jgi:hypothetical protein
MNLRVLSSFPVLFALVSCQQEEKPRATPTAVKVMKAQRRAGGQSNRYSASIDAATHDLAFKVTTADDPGRWLAGAALPLLTYPSMLRCGSRPGGAIGPACRPHAKGHRSCFQPSC